MDRSVKGGGDSASSFGGKKEVEEEVENTSLPDRRR